MNLRRNSNSGVDTRLGRMELADWREISEETSPEFFLVNHGKISMFFLVTL